MSVNGAVNAESESVPLICWKTQQTLLVVPAVTGLSMAVVSYVTGVSSFEDSHKLILRRIARAAWT